MAADCKVEACKLFSQCFPYPHHLPALASLLPNEQSASAAVRQCRGSGGRFAPSDDAAPAPGAGAGVVAGGVAGVVLLTTFFSLFLFFFTLFLFFFSLFLFFYFAIVVAVPVVAGAADADVAVAVAVVAGAVVAAAAISFSSFSKEPVEDGGNGGGDRRLIHHSLFLRLQGQADDEDDAPPDHPQSVGEAGVAAPLQCLSQ